MSTRLEASSQAQNEQLTTSATRKRGRPKKGVAAPTLPDCQHDRAYAVVAVDARGEYYQHAVVCSRCAAVQGRDYHTGIPGPWLTQDDAERELPDGARFDVIAGPSADVIELHRACVSANIEAMAAMLDRECDKTLAEVKAKPGREEAFRESTRNLYEGFKVEHRARLTGHLRTLEARGEK